MFAPPPILPVLDAVFWRANETAFDIKQRFDNGLGVVHGDSGSNAHQKRQIFNAAFPVFVENSLRKQIHGGRAEGCQTQQGKDHYRISQMVEKPLGVKHGNRSQHHQQHHGVDHIMCQVQEGLNFNQQ